MNDLISRSWLLDVFELVPWDTEKDRNIAIHHVRELAPSAQPEYSMDEWCTDCTEYDQERHCCPRFNRVIRETVDEVKNNQWIPCGERTPDTDRYVLCTTENKKGVRTVVRGYYTGDSWAVGMNPNVIAWMEMPEPYGGEG